MKYLFKANLIFFISVLILVFIPWLGVIFMTPVRMVQIISSLYLVVNQNKSSNKVNTFVRAHLVSATVNLLIPFRFIKAALASEWLIGMLVISGFRSIFSVYLVRTNHRELYQWT